MTVPGGRSPWCCCHLRDWLRRAIRREGGTTDTSPERAIEGEVDGGGEENGEEEGDCQEG